MGIVIQGGYLMQQRAKNLFRSGDQCEFAGYQGIFKRILMFFLLIIFNIAFPVYQFCNINPINFNWQENITSNEWMIVNDICHAKLSILPKSPSSPCSVPC
jgi:hypothetical protein